ncbi:alpha-L-fucosidase 2 [Diaminobutyricimonas aerilata]|uniref:Alpha-L-fucosidase 2 n=1 Tax=Diaminobutyricimonas aerilata TaxID=1162967 RepID=A0A2M9CN77_9MICO|nr:glycoside hydrolase family 95 protein [Diaminobutyricimonas aerilata]PJJ73353.1 alpha-L-fucosidase 2 [Diaminobutyricimonas aerilata]
MSDLDLDLGDAQHSLRLRWPEPAREWVEAAPLGNGRTGAMLVGGLDDARLQLNDSTGWSGTPNRTDEALDALVAGGAGPELLAEVRAAIDAGDYRAAERLLYTFEGPWSQEFLPLADLRMTCLAAGVTGGARELDLDRGVLTELFSTPSGEIRRTSWASAPDAAVVVHLDAEHPIELELSLSTPLRPDRVVATDGTLTLGVQLPVDGAPIHEEAVDVPHRYADGSDGYDAYGATSVAVRTDGTVEAVDEALRIRGARRIVLTVSTDTAARAWWNGVAQPSREELIHRTAALAKAAVGRSAQRLFDDHVADLGALLGASSARIGRRRSGSFDVATEVLRGDDDALVATVLFQFGRYVLASSSRPGSPPANLQGIWNDDVRPPWSSNYTININTEMNYWAAESTGLAECHGPLLDLVERISSTGAPAARRLYGTRGWVAHHNTDMWGWSLPVGNGHSPASWAIWMMGGLWLTDHVWQHYAYTLDRGFLRERAWPVLLGAAEFALDWMIDDGRGGLRTVPATSPENLFRGPDGHPESLAESATLDVAVIRALFERVRTAAAVLEVHHPVLDEIDAALPRMPGFAITADGRLREWGTDVVEVDPGHRHMSHMVAVYPLGLIDPESTPELAQAARGTLEQRGPGAMGWSWAWKIALRARLGDAEVARSLLEEASEPFEKDHRRLAPVDGSEWGGLLPNLFSTHPPFQLDGNYGFTAGIREMLLGTREGDVRLLPALPATWPEGELRGARVPGALEVDLAWAEGVPIRLVVRRLHDDAPDRTGVTWAGRQITVALVAGETVVDLMPLVTGAAA